MINKDNYVYDMHQFMLLQYAGHIVFRITESLNITETTWIQHNFGGSIGLATNVREGKVMTQRSNNEDRQQFQIFRICFHSGVV